MKQNEKPVLTEAERKERRKKRADEFWSFFLFTKNGKVKSATLIYSFSLSVLFLAVFAAAFLLLIDPIEFALAGKAPTWLVSLCESLAPALVGALLTCVPCLFFKDKRLVWMAYLFLWLYAIVVLIAVAAGLAPDVRRDFLRLYAMLVPAPLIMGTALSVFLYLRDKRRFPEAPEPREKRPWER